MTTNPAEEPTQGPLQFTVRYLFLLTLVVAIAILPVVSWGLDGLWLTVWLGLVGLAVLHGRHWAAAVITGLSAFVVLLILPTMNAARTPSQRNQCINKMRQIAIAINNYASVHGHFPPPYIADENGTPMHSWRVLILPYLEEKGLYDQYDFSKPWNHPSNLALAARMPSTYRCPSDSSPNANVTTTYVAVVGNETIWSPNKRRTTANVRNGISKTLLIVESTSSRTHWMAPSDATFSSIGPVTSAGGTLLLDSPHPGVSVCAFCDARVIPVSHDLPADKLKALLTADGGENLDLNDR